MRVEWCKAIARTERFQEEVELVVEEMKRTLLFFKWTAGQWEQLGEARGSEKMDEGTRVGIKAYTTRKAALYHQLVEAFIQDWYECLQLKSLGSDWLSDYPSPKTYRRRRLESNVKAYHPSASMHIDETHDNLVNDPQSDTEVDSAGTVGGIEIDFFDDLETLPL